MKKLILVMTLVFLIGCSGGAPTAPDSGLTDLITPEKNIQSDSSTMVWGLYDVFIDQETQTVDVLPARGLQFKANVTQFVQPPIGKAFYISFESNCQNS